MFTQASGEPVKPDTFTKEFGRLVRRAASSRSRSIVAPYPRTNLLQAGVHPKVASERAGHASVAITLDVYSHVTAGMQEDAPARIDAGLGRFSQGEGGKWVANRYLVARAASASLTY